MEGLIDTRNEYIEHIQDILSVAISKRLYAIYTDMLEEKRGLKGFQNELYSIHKWNNNIVNDEYKKIVKYTKCKYLPNLIKVIIITTVKIKIYEYKDQFDNIKIKIPNPEDFVHKCYIHAASFSWTNAYLYNRSNIKDAEYQNNLNIIEKNIRAIIKKTFRDFVPFDEIFRQIEGNLTDDVKQFKDTGGDTSNGSNGSNGSNESEYDESEASDGSEASESSKASGASKARETKDIKNDKKKREIDVKETKITKESKNIKTDEADEEESEAEASEADEEESETSEADEEESKAEDDEADEESEAEASEADEADEADEDEEESEAEDEESEADEASETDEASKTDEKVSNEIINVVKEVSRDNKRNDIVDISFLNNDYNGAKTLLPQEVSFPKSGQTNIQEKKESETMEHTEWNNVKDHYQTLSQNTVDYKINNKRYAKEDDSISVTSALSNITDVSSIKQIHINDPSNKSKKPSFF